MGRKSDIRTCRYDFCKHESREIDISCDEYVEKNHRFYHKDCYKLKTSQAGKSDQTKADLQLIKNLWITNISNTVNYSDLFSVLNGFLKRGIESDYLVFALQYCIIHKFKLNYPRGLKYYLDEQEIKDAYARKKRAELKIDTQSFSASGKNDDSPSFKVEKKNAGFGSIIKDKQG